MKRGPRVPATGLLATSFAAIALAQAAPYQPGSPFLAPPPSVSYAGQDFIPLTLAAADDDHTELQRVDFGASYTFSSISASGNVRPTDAPLRIRV